MFKRFVCVFALCLLGWGFAAGVWAQENNTVILATTTSVQDTGLLDALMEKFQKASGCIVKPVAVGTGQAIQMGKNGEADILWVHSPGDEIKFIDEGYGTNRATFMHNDFVILGPKNDPAKIKGAEKAKDAFKKIAAADVLFVSRGDNSGTHKKELELWREAGTNPAKEKYIETGQGMAAAMGVANEKQAYALCDRSTYLALKKSLNLAILIEGDNALLNRYSLILVNPEKFPQVKGRNAKKLFDFLLSKETKDIVENYGKDKYGQQIFFYDLEL